MRIITFTNADFQDPRLYEIADAYEEKARAGEYVRVGAFIAGDVTYIERAYVERVQAQLAEQAAIDFIVSREQGQKVKP